MAEGEVVGGADRVKFTARRTGGVQAIPPHTQARLRELAALMERLEQHGLVPVLDDDLVGGNCATIAAGDESAAAQPAAGHGGGSSPDDPGWPPGSLLVSRSGKAPGAVLGDADWVLLTRFDTSAWAAEFRSAGDACRPTSDAPLHAAALGAGAAGRYGWARAPAVAVHGHALAAGEGLERARRAGLPVSEEATLFSTPADLAALEALFRSHPYPQHRCFIRRGHGFTVLAGSVAEAAAFFEKTLLPLLTT